MIGFIYIMSNPAYPESMRTLFLSTVHFQKTTSRWKKKCIKAYQNLGLELIGSFLEFQFQKQLIQFGKLLEIELRRIKYFMFHLKS